MRSIFVITACLLLPIAAAAEELSTDRWFYEIDGDYGSSIADTVSAPAGYEPATEISDGGDTTWGVRQNCGNWEHTDSAPYMGHQAYTVACSFNPDPLITVRSEQHFVKGWRPGPDNQRSVSMAVRLSGDFPAIPTSAGGAFIAQLHGDADGLPFELRWAAVPPLENESRLTGDAQLRHGEHIPRPGYYLRGGVRYDEKQENGTVEQRQPDPFFSAPIKPNTWYRVMIQIDLRKSGASSECPDAIGPATVVSVAIMDNATGLWGTPATNTGRIGNKWNRDTGACVHAPKYNFKIGQYVVYTTNRVDYDNVSYGKRWSNITKNRLIGYRKSVLRLPFEERSGVAVQDRSYTWNDGSAGDPISDYDNDGNIVGRVTRISNGVNGRALRFPGTTGSYVNVPINAKVVDDFDVGNYMTVSAWFRTDATPTENKGLVMIDEFSDSWKLLLYMRGDGMAFGVRHPGTYSRLDHLFPLGRYADNHWHLVTGTYNRFAPDGRRIKLYIDGEKVMEGEGADLPILRGENQLVVGKYSVGGFFQGDIDDVGLFNYTMTGTEVKRLWLERLERGVP